jgi:hypothetical protein
MNWWSCNTWFAGIDEELATKKDEIRSLEYRVDVLGIQMSDCIEASKPKKRAKKGKRK